MFSEEASYISAAAHVSLPCAPARAPRPSCHCTAPRPAALHSARPSPGSAPSSLIRSSWPSRGGGGGGSATGAASLCGRRITHVGEVEGGRKGKKAAKEGSRRLVLHKHVNLWENVLELHSEPGARLSEVGRHSLGFTHTIFYGDRTTAIFHLVAKHGTIGGNAARSDQPSDLDTDEAFTCYCAADRWFSVDLQRRSVHFCGCESHGRSCDSCPSFQGMSKSS